MMGATLQGIWNNASSRALLVQTLGFVVFASLLAYFVNNAIGNMSRIGITSGFGFLDKPANFAIGESLIPYTSSDSYGHAMLVGLINTIKVALIACVSATFFGTLLGILRMNANPLLRGMVQAYVEAIRNTPLLLQLFFWYALILHSFPMPQSAFNPLPGIFMSNRGIAMPALVIADPFLVSAALAICIAVFVTLIIGSRRSRARTGRGWPVLLPLLLTSALLYAGLWAVAGHSFAIVVPEMTRFNFSGGWVLTPEFAALLFGLTLYTSAFISEIVRSGIQNISAGQREAARSLGMRWGQMMRLVVFPQALRVVIPPLTSTYMTLTKNSSLAVAIGYPDLVSVVNTSMNQTGQAVETIAILMGIYLAMSISISMLMNWYNSHVAIKER